MKSFVIVWLVACSLIAVVATGVGWFVGRTPQPAITGRPGGPVDTTEGEAGPFTEADAVVMVSRRLPATDAGDQIRRELQGSATVTYHSVQHWRVCYDAACWVAHGPGRYAEPENDAARLHETRPATPR